MLFAQELLKLSVGFNVFGNALVEDLLDEFELPHVGLERGVLDLFQGALADEFLEIYLFVAVQVLLELVADVVRLHVE